MGSAVDPMLDEDEAYDKTCVAFAALTSLCTVSTVLLASGSARVLVAPPLSAETADRVCGRDGPPRPADRDELLSPW